MTAAPRRIWLCADDYGMSPAVSAGIRELLEAGRINATSVMVGARAFTRDEAASLARIRRETTIAVGLHLTLTAPFEPLLADFRPLRSGRFLPIGTMLARGSLRRLDAAAIARETEAQLAAFEAAFGHPPDFVDGHQHVHHVPQVRDVMLRLVHALAPRAWVRQCGSALPWRALRTDRKAVLLKALAVAFRRSARRLGVATNPAFAGTYDFAGEGGGDFGVLFERFLRDLPDGGLVMCHPGYVDASLRALDPVTDQRERELAFFAGPAFPDMMARHGIALMAREPVP